jgi:hypothetical protein
LTAATESATILSASSFTAVVSAARFEEVDLLQPVTVKTMMSGRRQAVRIGGVGDERDISRYNVIKALTV